MKKMMHETTSYIIHIIVYIEKCIFIFVQTLPSIVLQVCNLAYKLMIACNFMGIHLIVHLRFFLTFFRFESEKLAIAMR